MRILRATAIVLFFAVQGQSQQTFNVPSMGFPTIQSAIDAAAPGDTLLIAAGTYAGGLVCNKAITIEGMGMGLTIIDGGLLVPCLESNLPADETLLLREMTLTRGKGCITHATTPGTQTSTLRLEQVQVSLGQSNFGGGIKAAPHARLELDGCEFLNNGVPFNSSSMTSSDGGAIYSQGHVSAIDCLFDGNSAHPNPNPGPVSGGGVAACVYLGVGGGGDFERCTFTNNKAGRSTCIQASSFLGSDGSLTIINCVFKNNSAVEEVAGINKGGSGTNNDLRLLDSLFVGNSSGSGTNSVLQVIVDKLEIRGCTFADNASANNSAALGQIQANIDMVIRNTIVSNNSSDHLNISLAGSAVGHFSHNLSGSSTFAGTGISLNNIEGIPAGFRDIASGDFRLLPGSAAMNAGLSDPMDPATDLDGLPRNQLGAPDMGCYELQPGQEDPGAAWTGTVPDLMGGFEDVLLVNGMAGDAGRRVNTVLGATMTIAVEVAPGTTSGHFIIWGRIGLPTAIETFPIPFAQGSMAFLPHILGVGQPALFTLASSSLPGGIFMTAPAPWAISASSLPFPLTITLQGLIETGGTNLRLTNAIAVHNL